MTIKESLWWLAVVAAFGSLLWANHSVDVYNKELQRDCKRWLNASQNTMETLSIVISSDVCRKVAGGDIQVQ